MTEPTELTHHMILSLPSSGSDWFARLVARHTRGANYYDKEFFNPACNWPHADALSQAFGCEFAGFAKNLKANVPNQTAIATANSLYKDLWLGSTEGYNFDKEVWSYRWLPFWATRFRCLVLTRSAEWTFPPSRARVWGWYDAIWHGYYGEDAGLMGIEQRALKGHARAVEELTEDADVFGVPVVEYEKLVSLEADPLRSYLQNMMGLHYPDTDLDSLARDILESRELPKCKRI